MSNKFRCLTQILRRRLHFFCKVSGVYLTPLVRYISQEALECTSRTKTTRGFDCLNTKKPEHAPAFL